MIYYLLAIMIIPIISYLLIKNSEVFLRFISVTTIISGYLIIIINHYLKKIIDSEIASINISKITAIIFEKARDRGLILALIGTIELIIYIFYISKKRITNR